MVGNGVAYSYALCPYAVNEAVPPATERNVPIFMIYISQKHFKQLKPISEVEERLCLQIRALYLGDFFLSLNYLASVIPASSLESFEQIKGST